MFSSGFFLLPGLASAEGGPAVVLAYLLGGLMVLPTALSAAELSTAMPRAGGPYFFLDRSLGPLVGTVTGLSTWLSLVLKTAFALVGIGAYLSLFLDLPIEPVAIALAALFAVLNIAGVKKTTGLQIGLVAALLGVLALFIASGGAALLRAGPQQVVGEQFTPFLPFGVQGLLATTGLAFVSYAGLTQVASVAEEVKNPTRTIPLGMLLSLLTATAFYVLGVFVMVSALEPDALREDLTPVATAAQEVMRWLPGELGVLLVAAAALAAFASTGNAGILSAARYPLAMARDGLVPARLQRLGRFQTPTAAVLLTSLLVVALILTFDVRAIAELASTVLLLVFALVNLAVIIMRRSGIAAYDPGFRSPLYPWTPCLGVVVTLALIVVLGVTAMLFTLGVLAAALLWYLAYARRRVARGGAIHRIFPRLGNGAQEGPERELLGIVREKGLRDHDPLLDLVRGAALIDLPAGADRAHAHREGARLLADRLAWDPDDLAGRWSAGDEVSGSRVAQGALLPHALLPNGASAAMALMRCRDGLTGTGDGRAGQVPVSALVFLAVGRADAGQQVRILAHLAERVAEPAFLERWNTAADEPALRSLLLPPAASDEQRV